MSIVLSRPISIWPGETHHYPTSETLFMIHPSHAPKFASREEAGRELAKRLSPFAGSRTVSVLGFPNGGASLGAELAASLRVPFDVMIVGKITAPACGGMALGAITHGGVRTLNEAMINQLHLSPDEVRSAVLQGSRRLARRETLYRNPSLSLDVADRTIILADDGSAPCSAIRDAIRLLRRMHAERVIVAIPAVSQHIVNDLRMEATEVVTLTETGNDLPAARYFKVFPRTSRAKIRHLLANGCPIAAAGN